MVIRRMAARRSEAKGVSWGNRPALSEANGDIVRSLRLVPIVAELMVAGAITSAEDYMSFKK